MLRRWRDSMSQFNFSIEHIKGKENVIADVLSRCEYKETEIPTFEDHSLQSYPNTTTSLLPFNPSHFLHFLTNSPTYPTNNMPPMRTHQKAPTSCPSRRRSLSTIPNLAEM